jgi:hypothetical protein
VTRAAAAFAVAAAACHHGAAPPPPPPDCAAVADHVQSLIAGPDARWIRDAFARRCAADAWAADVRACFAGEPSLHGGYHCKDRLALQAHEALDRDVAAVVERPPACRQYLTAVGAALRCDTFAREDREATEAYFKTWSAHWRERPPEAVAKDCAAKAELLEIQLRVSTCELPP